MEWKQIVNTKYLLSDTGLVKNTETGKYLKPSALRYPTVQLCTNGKVTMVALHKLVAGYFVPNPDNLPIVLHKDNDKQHYYASNLCWGTYGDNMEDAIQDGLNGVGRKVNVYHEDSLVATYRSLSATAKALGLANPANGGATHIKEACEGKIKNLKGFTFSYAEVT